MPPNDPIFTILPSPESRNHGSAACATRNGPRVFVANIASHCSGVIASSAAVSNAPALFTSRSIPPKNFAAAATPLRTETALPTSHTTACARTPNCCRSVTASAATLVTSREVTTTSAPSLASANAKARPMRRDPPVTTARFPLSRSKFNSTAATRPLYRPPSARSGNWSCSAASVKLCPPAARPYDPAAPPRPRPASASQAHRRS